MRFFVYFVVAVLAVASAEVARYDNYRVYRLTTTSQAQVDALLDLEKIGDYNFWSSMNKRNLPVDVMVPPHMRSQFHEFLDEHKIQNHIAIPDVQALISNEAKSRALRPKEVEWTEYHDLDEIYAWLDKLAADHPNIETVVAGTTYEKRDIKAIKITNGDNLPGVIIEAGIHAREWIGPAATSFIIDKVVNAANDSVLKRFNYLYVPSANPDGYEFTWKKDRLWRKTRQPYKAGFITCYGADPNRNWDTHWLEAGSDDRPCSDLFAGSAPFSEIEMKSLSDYFRSVHASYDLYISYHSFSQLLMFPWGYTSDPAPLHDLWQKIGDAAAASLQAVHGTKFAVGDIYNTIYPVSGSSMEWYYQEFNSTISYTYELRDTGSHGFVLPPEQIIPVGEEQLASFQTILEQYEAL